jgi:hypothetical protein
MRGMSIGRLPRRPRWLVMLIVGAAAIVVPLTTRLATASVDPGAVPLTTTASTAVGPLGQPIAPSSGCWVSGDLIGESNPAAIAGAVCSGQLP